MGPGILFFVNSTGLGFGLAMDAFSVSVTAGLMEPDMKRTKAAAVSGTFAAFQFAMPVIGWICVRAAAEHFRAFSRVIPYISLVLLLIIGGKLIRDGIASRRASPEERSNETKSITGAGQLLLLGVATSIDALSVGFTISEYRSAEALTGSLIIGAVTFAVCFAGVAIGKKFGGRSVGGASILGGAILIAIGLEIFIRGVLGV